MRRREFMAAACTAGLASVATSASSARSQESSGNGKAYFELRRYLVDNEAQQEQVTRFYSSVAIPALNRAGVQSCFATVCRKRVTGLYSVCRGIF